jgi:two-component system response regulator YesN
MGRKFSSYLLEVRMERSKILMATDATLHSYEIAEWIGLGNNPHYFSQVFRKYTGMTPKDYRTAPDDTGKK